VFFAYWERRVLDPIIHPAALKVRSVMIANLDAFLVGITLFFAFTANTYLIELPYYPGFQQPEFLMGLILVPSSISILVVAPIFGRMVGRYGPKPVLMIGFVLMGFGALLLTEVQNPAFQLGFINTGAGAPVPVMMMVAPIFILSGNIAGIIGTSNVIVLTVKPNELGVETAMNLTFRNLGSALAPVVVTALLTSLAVGPNALFSLGGFQACYVALAVCGLLGILLTVPLRNYRFKPGERRAPVSG
jgi:MFS family permease